MGSVTPANTSETIKEGVSPGTSYLRNNLRRSQHPAHPDYIMKGVSVFIPPDAMPD